MMIINTKLSSIGVNETDIDRGGTLSATVKLPTVCSACRNSGTIAAHDVSYYFIV